MKHTLTSCFAVKQRKSISPTLKKKTCLHTTENRILLDNTKATIRRNPFRIIKPLPLLWSFYSSFKLLLNHLKKIPKENHTLPYPNNFCISHNCNVSPVGQTNPQFNTFLPQALYFERKQIQYQIMTLSLPKLTHWYTQWLIFNFPQLPNSKTGGNKN